MVAHRKDTIMADNDEKGRRRIATILFLLSGILVITALTTLVARHGESGPRPVSTQPITSEEKGKLALAQAMQRALLALIVLVIIFAFGSLAWIRWSRRFRAWLLREPRPPTPAEDVWAMHRLPEEGESTHEDEIT